MTKEYEHIKLADPTICTGCAACANVCPNGCISMSEDCEGFKQPRVVADSCISCHKCEKSCPILNNEHNLDKFETKAFAVINKDEKVRMQSSSGGMFYALAKWVIEQGGVVFGARWDEKWEVMHDYTEDMEGVTVFMQSKYVQSKVGDAYKLAKGFLEKGRVVLFTGTPCQLGGLRAYLNKSYDYLIQVDMICHGVPSPGVWRSYLKDYVGKDQILSINMRDKTDGWDGFQFFTTTTTTTTRREEQEENPYFRGFLRNIYLRKCCYHCKYRTLRRRTDFTIADFWGVQNVCPQMDDNRGTSLVYVHSDKAYKLLNELNGVDYLEVNVNDACTANPSINTDSSWTPDSRKVFLKLWYITKGFRWLEYYIDNTPRYLIIKRRIKKWLLRK